MRELIALRMHRADALSLALFDRLAADSGREVVCCCDERANAVDTGGRPKIAWTRATLDALGVLAVPDAGWRCGDYPHYVLRTARRDVDRTWLIEPDVLINVDRLSDFFDRFATSDADLLAAELRPAAPDWYWYQFIAPHFATPYRCFFPLTRLTGVAADHLLTARRIATSSARPRHWRDWPNDESFVATALVAGGFPCRDLLDRAPGLYTSRTMRSEPAHDRADLLSRPPDGQIWHPVPDRPLAGTPYGSVSATALLREAEVSLAGAAPNAALLPLLLCRRAPASEQAAKRRAEQLLDAHFGAARPAATVAVTAVVARREAREPLGLAAPGDFRLARDVPLRRVPLSHVVPYAFDLMAREMLLTLHADPREVFDATFLYAAQRASARAVIRVPFGRLDAALGPADPNARPILVFSLGCTGSTLLDSLIGCVTQRNFSEPDTATQLGTLRRQIGQLGQEMRDRLAWHAISPLLRSAAGGAPDDLCAIKFRSQAADAMPEFLRVFPRARFVFMLRDRRAWARSTYRAFGHAHDAVAHRLLAGLRSLDAMTAAPVDWHVIAYEDVTTAPQRVLAELIGADALPPDIALRIAATMARDSQAGSTLRRDLTSVPAPGEDAWLAAFEVAWTAIRPAGLIDRLGLTAAQA